MVARQLVRAVRGKRSQVAFSRRLGYGGRPVADWEAGRRFPTPATLLRACVASGIDVEDAFRRFHPPCFHALGAADDAGIAAWLTELRASTPIIELAQRCGHPRFSVSRWLSGQSRPRLPQFLSLVEALTGRTSDLLAELVELSLVPALHAAHQREKAAKRLAFEEPWSAAIVRVIETEAYTALDNHRQGWIANVLKIDSGLEQRCLDKLTDAGLVNLDEATGKFVCSESTVDTHASEREMRQIKSHWARVGLARIEESDPETSNSGDVFSFNVISVSQEDLDHIRRLLRATYREIRSLVAASSPVEQVALVQLQLAAWNPNAEEAKSS